jgi:hypothetical protein
MSNLSDLSDIKSFRAPPFHARAPPHPPAGVATRTSWEGQIMPQGEGWFLDLTTGEAIPIHEHAFAVVENPRRFGLDPREIAGLDPVRDRIAILRAALKRGFCRVRAHHDEVSIEFDFPNRRRALDRIRSFLRKQGFGAFVILVIHDLRRRVGAETRFKDWTTSSALV